MSKSHQKKRNSALLYEFLVRAISSAIVENNDKRAQIALHILKKYFKQGTELYREFRLVNSLARTRVSSEHVAASILFEAKRAAREYDVSALDREKSCLIRDINKILHDENFYDRNISEYKEFATAQQLVNVWRDKNSNIDIAQLAKLEEQLMTSLISNKVEQREDVQNLNEDPGMNRLVMKLMMKKLNEKYSSALLPEQKVLLKSYAFSSIKFDDSILKQKLTEIRSSVLKTLENFSTDSKYVEEKLAKVRDQLMTESLEVIDDKTVSRFMLYVKLQSELESDEE